MRILLIAFFAAAAVSPQDAAVRKHTQDRAARLTPDAIITEKSTYWIIIPAAGSTPGSNNTFFRSDVMISNSKPTPQLVDISFCAQGSSCSTSGFQLMQETIPGNGAVYHEDFVHELGKSGLGTIDIRARNSDGTLDTTAKIDATSRIWTALQLSAGTAFEGGTTSQSFPGVKIDAVKGSAKATILGLRQDNKFRSNFGVYNDDPMTAHTFTVRIVGVDNAASASMTITVQPWSMAQVGAPPGSIWGNFMAFVTPDGTISNLNWAAWGSSTDNATGDGWVSIGSQND